MPKKKKKGEKREDSSCLRGCPYPRKGGKGGNSRKNWLRVKGRREESVPLFAHGTAGRRRG